MLQCCAALVFWKFSVTGGLNPGNAFSGVSPYPDFECLVPGCKTCWTYLSRNPLLHSSTVRRVAVTSISSNKFTEAIEQYVTKVKANNNIPTTLSPGGEKRTPSTKATGSQVYEQPGETKWIYTSGPKDCTQYQISSTPWNQHLGKTQQLLRKGRLERIKSGKRS